MQLRSRPLLFARTFADAVVTRPFLRALAEQRRADEPVAGRFAEHVAPHSLHKAA